ncbi:MAG: 30S ribosomal protein S4 [Verrucomicrobiota bacterium]
MARYIGPKERLSRRYGVPLFGPSKSLERRPYPPGQHGPARGGRRGKKSEYAIALAEKQKLRLQYGLLEKQFRRYFQEAQRQRGVTGTALIQLLERRLDNVIYRFGFANTRSGARQFVGHGHVLVNGRRCDIPSYNCRPGDVIAVRDNPRSKQLALRGLDMTQAMVKPDWVAVDTENLSGSIIRIPEREEVDPMVNEQLVVELYSR